jgi:hypothetical protein
MCEATVAALETEEGLPHIPSDAADLRTWADEYERTNFGTTPAATRRPKPHIPGLSRRFPGPALVLARHIVITALDDLTPTCLGYPSTGAHDACAGPPGHRRHDNHRPTATCTARQHLDQSVQIDRDSVPRQNFVRQ